MILFGFVEFAVNLGWVGCGVVALTCLMAMFLCCELALVLLGVGVLGWFLVFVTFVVSDL